MMEKQTKIREKERRPSENRIDDNGAVITIAITI